MNTCCKPKILDRTEITSLLYQIECRLAGLAHCIEAANPELLPLSDKSNVGLGGFLYDLSTEVGHVRDSLEGVPTTFKLKKRKKRKSSLRND